MAGLDEISQKAGYENTIDPWESNAWMDEVDDGQDDPYDDYIMDQIPQDYKFISSDRDFQLPFEQYKNIDVARYESSPDDDEPIKKYLGTSVSLISIIAENLLSHPFLVLRRQCQVYPNMRHHHYLPFTMMPAIFRLCQNQGITTMWKGLGSTLLVRGMTLTADDMISKCTNWPKEVNSRTSMKRFCQHLLLKCTSFALVMPFYAASLVETVQSDIASEKPGFFDVFREGAQRLMAFNAPHKGRMLPVWTLVGPSVCLSMSKYVLGLMVKGVSIRILQYRMNQRHERKGAISRNLNEEYQEIETYSTFISLIFTEVLFFPLETIVHRLQLQGTRTIIDNLDSGAQVVPILTNYQGFVDCYRQTLTSEGFTGFYKGFGALALQIAAHLACIRLIKWICDFKNKY